MKRIASFFILGVFLLLFQVSLLPHLFPFTPRPNLILIVLVYLALGNNPLLALFWTASIGLLYDALSGGPFGLFSLEFLALHVVLKRASRALVLRHPVFRAGIVLLSHFLLILFFAAILVLLSLPLPVAAFQSGQILLGSLTAGLLSLPLFVLLERFDRPEELVPLD
jgi:rod shape-determining protein MreD